MSMNTAKDAAEILKRHCGSHCGETEFDLQVKNDMLLLCTAAVAHGEIGTGAVKTAAQTLAALDTIIELAVRMRILDDEKSETKKGGKTATKNLKEREGGIHRLACEAARYG